MTQNKQRQFDKKYMSMASIWGENSHALRRKVGCLVVKDGMIISDGYNGTPSGFENECEIVNCDHCEYRGYCPKENDNVTPSLKHCKDCKYALLKTKGYVLHAESNAITKLAKSSNSSDGATLYTTLSPCLECSKLIIQSGIKRVVYLTKYRDTDGVEILKRAGIEVTQLGDERGNVEAHCVPSLTNGHTYVDLGLPSGTLWATCNVGATSPEQSGKYFQWGDTVGYTAEELGIDVNNDISANKKQFYWSDYKFSVGRGSSEFSNYDATDTAEVLDLEDDAAHVNMGGNWRMPTIEQFHELIDKDYTTSEWTTLNGVNGRCFISRVNGNTLFIPASGYLSLGSQVRANCGYYWSATRCFGYIDHIQTLFTNVRRSYNTNSNRRCDGLPVRGVFLN